MPLKVAHFVIAHKAPLQLLRLVRRLQSPGHLAIVHVDQKSDGPEWDRARDELRDIGALLASPRSCNWGDYTFVDITLSCLDKLAETGRSCDFVNQISGQDYLIRPLPELEQHLSQHVGECLMQFHPFPYPDWTLGGYDRLPTWRNPFSKARKPLIPLRFARRFHKRIPFGHKPFAGSAWWCIPFPAAQYLHQFLRDHPRYADYWKRAWIPDEMVVHTVLGNSPFKPRSGVNYLHHIQWSPGKPNPDLLTHADLDNIKASGRFFARKFDEEQHPGLLDRIDAELLRP